MQTFYWFDFETFGANPARDRPAQFAGLRTDWDLNPIDDPLVIYCKPSPDFLPSPEACLVTGITPQEALEKGLNEREFFRQIHLELSTANTCAVGYNSIRFDDEVIRFGLYRNFFDPYAREWQDGNSRWDILDLLRMTHALRPDGINWVYRDDGSPSFRLEELTQANGIEHSDAHDALADVHATIAMARLVKQKQSKLFSYLLDLRSKRRVRQLVDVVSHKPFVHCSAMLGPEHAYCGVMMPLCKHPTNGNSVICIDLSKPLPDLSTIDQATIQRLLFTRSDELADDELRLPIKEVHLNKCPAVAPLGVMDMDSQERLGIDVDDCIHISEWITSLLPEFLPRLLAVYQERQFTEITDPDYALYSGGFFNPSDRDLISKVQRYSFEQLAEQSFAFADERLHELLFRFRARNAPQTLSADEQVRWLNTCRQKIQGDAKNLQSQFDSYFAHLHQLQSDASPNEQRVLQAVESYARDLQRELQSK